VINPSRFCVLFTVPILQLSVHMTAFAHAPDCGTEVSLRGDALLVVPTGSDDTENIQCALEQSKALGITTVRLGRGDFHLTSIEIEDFKGILQGTGIKATNLEIPEDSIDCANYLTAGRTPAVMKFINGDVKIAKMTLTSHAQCISKNSDFALIHFTGRGAEETCGRDRGFGSIDRMKIISRAETPRGIAVFAGAEGVELDTCNNTQLGSLEVNRSHIEGFAVGVWTELRGQAQVEINFNTLRNNDTHIVGGGNQLLSVQSNRIKSSQNDEIDSTALFIDFWACSPSSIQSRASKRNRVVFYNNRVINAGIMALGGAPECHLSLDITDNRFQRTNSDFIIVLYQGVAGASITRNSFSGSGIELYPYFKPAAIFVGGYSLPSFENTIVGNDFSNYSSEFDIHFEWAFDNIVGPGQTDKILDTSGRNIIIP